MLVMNQTVWITCCPASSRSARKLPARPVPVGRQVAADTDWKMKAEILTYSRSRGAFAGIDLNGASLKQDKDETALLYGKPVPFEAILSGTVPPPEEAKTFLAAVRKYSAEAAENKQGN